MKKKIQLSLQVLTRVIEVGKILTQSVNDREARRIEIKIYPDNELSTSLSLSSGYIQTEHGGNEDAIDSNVDIFKLLLQKIEEGRLRFKKDGGTGCSCEDYTYSCYERITDTSYTISRSTGYATGVTSELIIELPGSNKLVYTMSKEALLLFNETINKAQEKHRKDGEKQAIFNLSRV